MTQSEALQAIQSEASRAAGKHAAFNSFHEGYAVILEELDEVWEEVKKKVVDKEELKKEIIQVGAMAVRFLTDLH
jgi:NTP pyrophosphatase (non-canonical NTP hydrolase)